MTNYRAAGALVLACLAVTAMAVTGVGSSQGPSSVGPQPTILSDDGAPGAVSGPSGDEPVRVGVIGTGFDPSNPALQGRIGSATRIGGPRLLAAPSGHGTAVAEIVAERSPDARLYLVSVGRAPTPERYERAVDWLLTQDVDVIVDAGSYFPRTAAGLDRIEQAADRAAQQGVAVVTSAGNYATRHWRGTAHRQGWVSFADDADRNRLGDGAIEGRVTLRLYWQGAADYDLYLYRSVTDGPDELVASSRREAGGAEAIDTTVSAGEYYVRVYAERGGEPVDLFAASHRLTHADASGSSLPPATVDGVISVGATGLDGERAFSSAGRDVTAPDGVETTAAGRFTGTSAATPLVGGTVSELIDADGDLSPSEIERVLRETADGPADRLDSDDALRRVRNETDGSDTRDRPKLDGGTPRDSYGFTASS